MAIATLADLRQEVAERLTAELTGWRESVYAYDWFGTDARTVAHRSFAVGVRGDTPKPDELQRQRARGGAPLRVESSLAVAFAWRLRGDAHRADQDEGLAAVDDVLRAVMSVPGRQKHYRGSSVSSLDADSAAYLLVELRFDLIASRLLE